MLSVLLFLSHFSIRIQFAERKYRGLGYAVDCPVDGVKSHFSCSPLLYHGYINGRGKRSRKRKSAALEAGEPEPEPEAALMIEAPKPWRAPVARMY
jgi:hypothetical protein